MLPDYFRLRVVVCLVTVLFLAGCASVGTRTGTQGGPPEPTRDACLTTAQWQPMPNPDNDLWIIVRNSFELPTQCGHPGIQKWVNYYLEHDKHLSNSIRRARPFLWHVVDALTRRGLPMDLALLPIVESGYNAGARSYSGAGGLWQFMPPTASDMGLRQGWWYDGRFDVLASTRAAMDYLSWLHDYFDGNWLLAIAAYNAGPGRVEDAVAAAGTDNFWQLDLPAETTAYVPKLLALRRLLAAPARYGLRWPYLVNSANTVNVDLPAQIEVNIAADMLNMPEAKLRKLNPGIKHSATAPGHAADLLIPTDKVQVFQIALASTRPEKLVNHNWYRVRRGDTLSDIARTHNLSVAKLRRANGLGGNRIYVGQRLSIPGPAAPVTAPTQPYVVQPGDTLWQIAHRHGISIAALRRVNRLGSDVLRPGQTLALPTTAGPATHRVASGESLWTIAQQYDVSIAQLRQWNRLGNHAVLHPGQELAVSGPAALPDFYIVEDGDTLWGIAHQFGMQVATLRNLNEMGHSNSIQSGQRLRLQPAG